jgi:hypothetical protein
VHAGFVYVRNWERKCKRGGKVYERGSARLGEKTLQFAKPLSLVHPQSELLIHNSFSLKTEREWLRSICGEKKMRTKRLLIVLLPFLSLMIIPFVQAATITVCTFDKDKYNQGETGYITVTIYNDEETKIRVTELTATINYYYTDGNVYTQKFYTNATLPEEIHQGEGNSGNFYIPFSLPTNIASGYTDIHVKAITELWNEQAERWFGSEHPTYEPTLYIESPYKQQSEGQQVMIYLLGAASMVFAAVTVFLFILSRRARFIKQPIA